MRRFLALLLALLLPVMAHADAYSSTIALDADSSETYAPATRSTLTHSHTSVGTPSIVICQAYGCANAPVSATYGGQAMTRSAAWHGASVVGDEMFYLLSPPTGAQSAVITLTANSANTSGFVVCSTFTGTGTNTPEGNCPGAGSINTPTSTDTLLQNAGRGTSDWQWQSLNLFASPAETVTQTTDTQVANLQISCLGSYFTFMVSRETAGGDGNIHYSWTNPIDFNAQSIAIIAARQSIISPSAAATVASDSNFVATKGCQVLR